MSKLRKSELSPSITQGSNAIDLGKNSGVDMGQKSQPSITSGGIGVTQEVTSIGGMSVTGGVSVDIAPLNFGITANPSEGFISVAGGAEVPGGLIGISGGVTIDTNTGEIIGGSIGGEVGGLGINVSNSQKGGLGIEFTLQIPGTPIEISLGFGFPPPEEPTPTPTPTPTPNLPTVPPDPPEPPKCKKAWVTWQQDIYLERDFYTYHPIAGNTKLYPKQESFTYNERIGELYNNSIDISDEALAKKFGVDITGYNSVLQKISRPIKYYTYHPGNGITYSGVDIREVFGTSIKFATGMSIEGNYYNMVRGNITILHKIGYENSSYGRELIGYEPASPFNPIFGEWQLINKTKYKLVCGEENQPPPPPYPLPNPSPRKRNMDECCRLAIALTRANRRFLQEILLMLGRPLNAQGNLTSLPKTNFFGEPVERIQTPIGEKQEKETIVFNNYYELLMYGLKQQINLDVAIDPQSFAIPTGKLQNPNYQRDSEQSLENNVQPEEDKKGNKRELELGIDVRINSISQQQQYLFEAVKRLEYLLPAGELADAKFEKSLIIPGATGELQIHNLIHFKEFLIQFLNATLGNPKIPVKIEDNNALKKGKQKATLDHFSMSQMIRELYRVVLESGDDINSIMEIAVRNFRTSLANRIQIVQIAEMTQALVEDTGMLEEQVFIPLKLDGDPYAGKWKAGMGFEPDADLDSNTEAATEKLMRATLNNFEAQVKVIRRDKKENADIRDLLLQLAEMFIRLTAIPATKEGIEKALAAGRFKVKVDNAISRSQVKRAAAAKLSRTKKRKK